jgi:hypothetical protein
MTWAPARTTIVGDLEEIRHDQHAVPCPWQIDLSMRTGQ